jgi:ABC-type branched-subunit amino acid transport system ATPase component
MTELIAFAGLAGGYGDSQVVFNLGASVQAGQALGVFGRNGVGKSTLARLLQGSLQASKGTITLKGQNIASTPPFQRHLLGLGYMPQTAMVFDELTVGENLSIGSKSGLAEAYFEIFPTLAERLKQKAGTMSGGERKILSFVRLMAEDTNIIVLDEPSEGVQPENISRMEQCLLARKKQGSSIILIEQNLTLLRAVADQLLGMDAGKPVLQSTLAQTSRAKMLEVLSI